MKIYLVVELFGGIYQRTKAFTDETERDRWYENALRNLLDMHEEPWEEVLAADRGGYTDSAEYHLDTVEV